MNRQVSEQVKKTITDEQAGFRTSKKTITDEQAGFRASRSTREHISNMRVLMKYQQDLHHVFVDFSKGFNKVRHKILWTGRRKYNPSTLKLTFGQYPAIHTNYS